MFTPPPKVRSGVLRLTRNDRTDLGCDPADFKKVVKQAFSMRRKTLRNSLAPLLAAIPSEKTAPIEPLLTERPERLSVDQFVLLTNILIQK